MDGWLRAADILGLDRHYPLSQGDIVADIAARLLALEHPQFPKDAQWTTKSSSTSA